MILDERQSDLLELIIRDYIKTARPVASARLVRYHRLAMSPATARNEMLALDEMGFLEQPHHAAGRIPTGRAYRFFVNRLADAEENEESISDVVRPLREADDVCDAAVKIIANRTKNLGVAGWFEYPGSFRFSGLAEMLRQPEFSEGGPGADFVGAFETVLEESAMLHKLVADARTREPHVYIGRENPLKTLRGWSVVVSRLEDGEEREGVIAIIGPTRMPYGENIGLAGEIARRIEELLA
jgi:transcriptional regulator of heat shock response